MKFQKIKEFMKSKMVLRIGAVVLAAVVAVGGMGYHAYAKKSTEQSAEDSQSADADSDIADETQNAGAGSDTADETQNAGAGSDTANEEQNAGAGSETEESLLSEVLKTQTDHDTSEVQKEETVYAVTDADGTVNEVIVSEWLKNLTGSDTLEDATDLTNIENVKGDETYTAGEDGSMTWQADGNDIYYQGETTKELPVDLKITYTLDGEEISADELAGKSGKVTIRMDYTNKEETDGVYVPFTAVTGILLGDNFSNVEVTNGKVISDGSNQIVVGFAFPGLAESLELSDTDLEDIEIPDYVELTADVEDFSLDMTLTFLMSDILQELDIDSEIDLTSIEESIDTLTDASEALTDGSAELSDGAATLANGISAYTDGVASLKDGITAFTEGVSKVKIGVDSYTDGVAQVASGTKQLAEKSGDLSTGITELVSGATQIQTYFEGDSGLVNGSKALADGVNTLDETLNAGVTDAEKEQAQAAVDAMFAATDESGQTYEQQLATQAAAQYQTALTSGETGAAIESQVESGVSSAVDQISQAYSSAYQQAMADALTAVYQQSGLDEATASAQAAAVAQSVAEQVDANADFSGAVSTMSEQIISGIASGTASTVGQSVASAAKSGAVAGAQESIGTTKAAVATQIEQGGLVSGAQTLSSGISQLYTEGIEPLALGMTTLSNSVPELVNGIETLNDGASTLNANSQTLKDGVNTLNTSGSTLNSGASTLNSKSSELTSGAETLSEGAKTLSDSMAQFDEEGIQKIADAYHGDVESLLDRIDAVLDAGENYHSLGGLKDGMSGSVRFVIRTEGIEE